MWLLLAGYGNGRTTASVFNLKIRPELAVLLGASVSVAALPITAQLKEGLCRALRWWMRYTQTHRAPGTWRKALFRIFRDSQAIFPRRHHTEDKQQIDKHEKSSVLGSAGRDEHPADGARWVMDFVMFGALVPLSPALFGLDCQFVPDSCRGHLTSGCFLSNLQLIQRLVKCSWAVWGPLAWL